VFRLNGRRIYLRSSHTGNCSPVGLELPHDPDWLRRDLINTKMTRFNCLRFIAGVAKRYQLDLCDEIAVFASLAVALELGRGDHGVVIGAGTGTGKTKAAFIPAFADVVAASTAMRRTPSVMAIYPRIELLKDQLLESPFNFLRP
jgi:hypothetical protein